MMHFKKNNKIDSEIIDHIAKHIDSDIKKILDNEPLNMGNRNVPPFDEYKVYNHIIDGINQTKKKNSWTILKWACVIALLIVNVSYFGYNFIEENEITYNEVYTSKGEKLLVLLTDGSRIWLNADSKLIYPEKFNGKERKVSLTGEGYFEIRKNTNIPFIVMVDQMKVKVTGTKFNIKAYPVNKEITTTLDEGRISIGQAAEEALMYNMSPGQTAIYEKEKQVCRIRTNENYREDSEWKNNRLTFRNTPLKEVLITLGRQFDVSFDVKDSQLNAITYTFVSKRHDLNSIFETMESITPIKFYKKTDHEFILKARKTN